MLELTAIVTMNAKTVEKSFSPCILIYPVYSSVSHCVGCKFVRNTTLGAVAIVHCVNGFPGR